MQQAMLFDADLLKGPTGPEEIERLREKIQGCQACKLCDTRTQIVFGVGNATKPQIAFVGEAPGFNEDQTGKPFVGNAGKLLNAMIDAMKLQRSQLYICNVINCRPPENRKPLPEEVSACAPYLLGQLRAIEPRIVVALGGSAGQALLKSKKPLKDLRGKWHDWEGTPLRVTFHPAFLLREPSLKKEAWRDLQDVLAKLRTLH